jgi:hypothetical protein
MTVFNNEVIRFESVSSVTLTPDVEVGTRRREGDEDYIYVYNAGNSQILPGNGCILSAVTGYSISLSSVTSIDQFIGIVKHEFNIQIIFQGLNYRNRYYNINKFCY